MLDIKKIEKILSNHEQRILKLEGKIKSSGVRTEIKPAPALYSLFKSSFFNQPQKYGQIIKQLKINANFLPKSNYKKELAILVKEGKLVRKQVEHQWVYFKNG